MKYRKLFTDDFTRKQYVKRAETNVSHLNTLILLVETDLKRKLTDKEKQELFKKEVEPFQKKLIAEYPFPNGTQKVNEDAMGISLRQSKPYCDKFYSTFKDLPCVLKKGIFVIEDYEKIPEVLKCTRFAETPKQINALKYSEKLCKVLNNAPKGCINRNITDIEDTIVVIKHSNGKFVPNGVEINDV